MNADAAWKTPYIDKIAEEGIRFTDAHSGSAVCSPTRYGVLTGRYAWRTHLKEGVLWSWDPPLIRQEETTVGKLLQEKGYTTACVGKWHLGLDWAYHAEDPDSVDFSRAVSGGPTTLGFDYFFGITASLDIPPYVYIENDRPTMVPVNFTRNDSEYGWWRNGLTGEDFVHEEVLPVLTHKAVAFIDRHMASGISELQSAGKDRIECRAGDHSQLPCLRNSLGQPPIRYTSSHAALNDHRVCHLFSFMLHSRT